MAAKKKVKEVEPIKIEESYDDEVDTSPVIEEPEIDPNEEFIYINAGKDNLFTESGPCRPKREVVLTEAQASKYKGLAKQ